jgi:hypothetical protein
MDHQDESRGEGRTDIAALAAGAMAVAISMFLISGPFDALSAMVAVTLTLVIIGYVWKNRRSTVQSLAVAALLGIVAIPITGFALELLFAHDAWSLLVDNEPLNCRSGAGWRPCASDEHHSKVNNLWQIGTWLVVCGIAFVADRQRQRDG